MGYCKVKRSLCSSSRRLGACTGACGRAGQVVCGGCGFAVLWRFPEEEAALGNHSAQSPFSVFVASPGHAMGHCKVKCSLCSVKEAWRGLHWGLRPGPVGGSRGLGFGRFVEISRGGGSSRQPQRTEPCQFVGGQPWAFPRGTARSNAASAVCSRSGRACAGGCGRTGQVVCGSCGFTSLWRVPEEE